MLIFIRHYKTNLNSKNLIQTLIDVSIENIDENIISEKQKILSKYNEPIILTSNLKRTKETSIQLGYNDFNSYDFLNEVNMSYFDLINRDEFIKFSENELREKIENYNSIKNRIKLLSEIINLKKNYFIFTHGIFIKCILQLLNNSNINIIEAFTKLVVKPLDIIEIENNDFKNMVELKC